IYTMNADGSNPIRVTINTTSERNPAWTPDGTRIVFNSVREGDAEIFIINAAGGPETQLTNNETTDAHPVVSPDGSRVAFVSGVTGFTIYTMNLDGTGALPLTAGLRPDWSPDGETITFQSGGASDDVSIISASGTGQINLTGSSPSNDDSPAFSPDGTLIAFVSEQFGNRDIFTMTTSGENQTNLTNNPASDISPDWQPTAPIGTSTTSTSSTTSTTVVPVNSCLASLQAARASFNAQIDRHGEALTRAFGSRAADAVASLERTRDEGNARFSAAIARCPRDGT
ncbi:MAG: TolB family protein, partial [Acidimicrobiales bacterium]